MTDKTYELAKQLKNDIKLLNRQIKEVEEQYHWITTSTPNHNNGGAGSHRFQKELVEWMKQTVARYQEEFDNL